MSTNIITKRVTQRIYPTKQQEMLFNQTVGCCRVVRNMARAQKRDAYEKDKTNLKLKDLSKIIIEIKNSDEFTWLNQAPATCLTQELMKLMTAYTNFFKHEAGYPKYKNKSTNGEAAISMQDCYVKNGRLVLPKFKEMKVKWTHNIPDIGRKTIFTMYRDKLGHYYISFTIETEVELFKPTGKQVGVDMGLTHFATLSDGTKIDNPRFLKRQKKALRRSQRAHSRSQKGSKRKEKKRLKMAKISAKSANQRNDFHHKTSTQLVKDNDIIVVEALKILNMMKNHKLAGSIQDAGIGNFLRMIEYKCAWYGKTFVRVNPAYTSKICSCCGEQHETPMSLNIRQWTCVHCGAEHDRDINAAINILNRGLNELNYVPVGSGKQVKITDVDIIGSTSGDYGPLDATVVDEASIRSEHLVDGCDVRFTQ